ncbi:RNA polymerase sigma factor [Paenibacillus pasadenensis]|uniref:RNA polymerase sigma factor n=1 Tax=Paenibacillus TaxID=44249 RepID=UPI0003FE3342|nr:MULTISPECIES: RNA polymerase sigma factor [Paenibacillus]QGG58435.1 RNA polymerase subunit sigma-24 [Paenibacillus sp. B01]
MSEVRRTIEAVWSMEAPKLIAALTRLTRDVGIAEDLAQDALVAALEKWPQTGLPDNPGAWLMTTARRRGIDLIRRSRLRERKYEQLAGHTPLYAEDEPDLGEGVGDDLLRLIFLTCHPVLAQESRVALTLRLLCGLTTEQIARSYLAAEPAIAQRIVRAKRTLAAKQVAFELPEGRQLQERLSAVLEALYLMFNEGYAATSGDDLLRPLLCREALRLSRVLAELMPGEPEVHGLAALLELQSSRLRQRVAPDGRLVRLRDQNRARWDRLHMRRGLAALERGRSLGRRYGPYLLQAAIAACHAEAPSEAETDWVRISALYEALMQGQPSPVVELNRAVAVAMAFGPAIGLAIADELERRGELAGYHLLPSVRGELLQRLGRPAEARAEFERAAGLARNARERELLLEQAAACEAI